MTQKEKLIKANLMAMTIKNIAKRLEFDGQDYGVHFTESYAKELISLADDFLKKK